MQSQVDIFLKTLEKKEKIITYLKNIYKVEVGSDAVVPEAYIEGKLDNKKFEELVTQREKEQQFSTFEEKVESLKLPSVNDKNIKLKIAKLKKAKDSKLLIKHLNISNYQDRGMSVELLKRVVDGLKILTSVEDINLRKNNFDDSYADIICELFNIENLNRIDLSYNNLSKTFARKLINVIKNGSKLEYLDLTYNPFNFDEYSCSYICLALKTHTKLYHFGLCDSSRDSAIRIFQFRPDIRSLNLEDSRYQPKSFELLSKYLTDNKRYSLAVLSLKYNAIDLIAASHLEKSLRLNRSLVYLNLYSTGLSDLGGSRIISALDSNKTLIEMDVGANKLAESFCRSFNRILKMNNILAKVNISKNNAIMNEHFALILEGLVTNQSLVSLGNLEETKIGVKLRESAEIILDLNEKFLERGQNANKENNLAISNNSFTSIAENAELNRSQKMNFFKSSIDFEGQEKIKRENLDAILNKKENLNIDNKKCEEEFEDVIRKYDIKVFSNSSEENFGFFIY